MKKIMRGAEARKRMRAGAVAAADVIASTLGPRGKNVVIDKGFGAPVVTKDGATVARELDELDDPVESMGAKLLIQASDKTNKAAGDGTTTAAVIAKALIEATDHVTDVQILKSRMQADAQSIMSTLETMAVKADTLEMLEHVATISANNDSVIGKKVAKIVHEIGKDGVITVEDSHDTEITTERVDGLQIDRGYASHYFANQEDLSSTLEDVSVLVTDTKFDSDEALLPVLRLASSLEGKKLFVLCDGLSGDAMRLASVNHIKGAVNVCFVTNPGYGDRRLHVLHDVAALTGATVMSADTGNNIEKLAASHLGKAAKIKTDADKCLIVGGYGDAAVHLASLKTQLDKTESEYDKSRLQDRIARLSGGVGVIRVGGTTESAAKETRFIIDDAVAATRAAMRSGVLPGGGSALLAVSQTLNTDNHLSKALCEALRAPLRRIAENSEADPKEIETLVLEAIGGGKPNAGFDAKTGVMMDDMIAGGIVDPLEVTKQAVQNAVSVAVSLLSTSAVLYERRSDEDSKKD